MVGRFGTGRESGGRERAKTPNRRGACSVLRGRGQKHFLSGFCLGRLATSRRLLPHKLIRRLGPRREPVSPRLRVPDEDDVDVAARARVAPDARLDGTTHGLDHEFRLRLRLAP